MLSILRTNINKFWRILSPKSRCDQLQLSNSDGEPIHSSQCATVLNNYFTSVFTSNSDTIPQPEPTSSDTFPDIVISPEGITSLIRNLKLPSSAGCDKINSKLLKNTAYFSSQILYLLFTQSLQSGCVPDDWKIAQIVPIFKAGIRSLVTNYRPISLTSIPSKLLEHILTSNLMSHLESISYFYPHQHGFRKHYSCQTQLAEFTHDLLQQMDNNLQVDAVLLDFSKAFDRVSHNHLLAELSSLNIPFTLLSWIEHFLKGRTQFTSANHYESDLTNVTSGVPQGASLSPVLFLIYINDLPLNINSKLRLFADDCVLYTTITSTNDHNNLQTDLNNISLWCNNCTCH